MTNQWNKGLALERSKLASLRPVGYGTSSIESLESYVHRVALVHRVPRNQIERYVQESLGVDGSTIHSRRRAQPLRLDAATNESFQFAARLADLTKRPQVARIGFGVLSTKLAVPGLLRHHHAWCPDCFASMRHHGEPAYWPLLWSISTYFRCARHERFLQFACPACSRQFSFRRSWLGPMDHCPNCGEDLANMSGERQTSFAELSRQQWKQIDEHAARLLGELVAVMPEMPIQETDYPEFGMLVESAVRRQIVSAAAQLARRAGISTSTFYSFVKTRRTKPSLDVMLRLCVAADVSLTGLFHRSFWHEGLSGRHLHLNALELPRQRRTERPTWHYVMADAKQGLAEGRPSTVCALARKWNVDQRNLTRHLGALAAALRSNNRRAIAQSCAERTVELSELLVQEADRLRQAGKRVSARKLASLVRVRRGAKIFRDAYKIAIGKQRATVT